MTHLLGLDIGKRRTGVAFADTRSGIVMALDTLHHKDEDELIESIEAIVQERKIEKLAIGIPKLLDGTEGEQASYVRALAEEIGDVTSLPFVLIDERYSSYGTTKENADAKAACSILETALSQHRSND